jgi:hypothetical protein
MQEKSAICTCSFQNASQDHRVAFGGYLKAGIGQHWKAVKSLQTISAHTEKNAELIFKT